MKLLQISFKIKLSNLNWYFLTLASKYYRYQIIPQQNDHFSTQDLPHVDVELLMVKPAVGDVVPQGLHLVCLHVGLHQSVPAHRHHPQLWSQPLQITNVKPWLWGNIYILGKIDQGRELDFYLQHTNSFLDCFVAVQHSTQFLDKIIT